MTQTEMDQEPHGTLDPNEGSTDYSQYGVTNAPKYTTTTALGKTKTFAGLYLKEWAFLVISTVNILTAIGLTTYRLIKVLIEDPNSPDFTFTILLLINAGFSAFYVIHGVLRERKFELYALIAAILVVTVYCLLEYTALNVEKRTTIKLVRLIAACVLAPPNIFLAWVVAKNFGYLEFKIVGASKFLQHIYQQAAIFSCFLKLDLQASSSFVILCLRDGTDVNLLEQVTLGVGIPYTILWVILGWFVIRKELKIWAWIFGIVSFVKPAYYIFKVISVYIRLHNEEPYSKTIVYSQIASGALALLVWLILMVELIVVYKNFDKGLRVQVFDTPPSERTSLLTGRRSR